RQKTVDRRQWLKSASQTTVYCLLSSAYSSAQSPDAWPQFCGDHNLTGVSPSTVNPNLKMLWSLNAGEIIESSAALSDGTAYVGTGLKEGGELIAVGLWDGKLKWKYKTKEAVGESSPAVANGLVFVGDLAGFFHAVNAGNGQGVWTYKSGGEIKS